MRQFVLVSALIAPWILVVGCCCLRTDPTVESYVGEDAKVQAQQLRFADEATGARFHRLRDDFAGRGAGHGWNHYPLRKIGNFVQEDWCTGPGSDHTCAASSFRERRGARWLGVYTLHYDSDWPDVFGFGVTAGDMPVTAEWGASFSYHADGAGIMGEGMYVTYSRFERDLIAEEVHLGDSYGYVAEEESIRITAPGTRDEELKRLLDSPGSLRDTAVERLDTLLAEVERAIEAGEVLRCDYGEYQNDGIPPPCTPRVLTEDEAAALVVTAREDIGAQRAAVETNHALFHRQLVELVDFENCW